MTKSLLEWIYNTKMLNCILEDSAFKNNQILQEKEGNYLTYLSYI